MNFIVRGEAILIGFLQGFFSQDKLFGHIENQFKFDDNLKQDSLIIKMTESFNDETVNAVPAIIIQEGGFQEVLQATNNNQNYWTENTDSHFTPFIHPYTLHCISQTKASAKLLQAATAKSIITFRKALYSMGIDNIGQIQGGPPIRLSPPDDTMPGYYDATIMLNLRMDQHWLLGRTGDVLESIRFACFIACSNLEFDESGNPAEPVDEWIEHHINIDWS